MQRFLPCCEEAKLLASVGLTEKLLEPQRMDRGIRNDGGEPEAVLGQPVEQLPGDPRGEIEERFRKGTPIQEKRSRTALDTTRNE